MIQHFNGKFEKLSDVVIETPNKDEIIKAFNDIDNRLVNATSGEEAIKIVKELFSLSDDVRTIFSMIFIRHTINTTDKKYDDLSNLLNEIGPEIDEASNQVDKDFINSKFRKELEAEFGELMFKEMELSNKTFSSEIVPDLVEENKLSSEYVNLISGALIEYKGEKLSIPQMGKYTSSLDRATRAEASELVWKFYAENDDKIGDIYDRMVKVRTKIAQKLGYKNFLQLGYDRMGRLDWNSDDAQVYRDKILEYIVPLSNKIFAAQKERLGYGNDTKYYDYSIFYKTGNPTPKGDTEYLISAAQDMYSQLSPIASKYFNFMVEHGCLDLDAKPGKAGGGYMDYIPGLKTAFIFSNSNRTSGDVDTLTHEFGHSLQGFLGGEIEIPAYRNPGMECCEMHSMSMEYLTYPWMNLFFKEDTDKYHYQHLCDAITFIPYGSIVDAFQVYVYEHPEISHKERKAYWRKLEEQFLPHRQYEGNEFLTSGGYWMRQHHIFENPLYYLDYTIAQIVALEFFDESREDSEKAFSKYIAFDKLGGTLPFRSLLKKAGIKNPMEGDTLKEVASSVMDYLSKFNPSLLDK
ncbi:MAG: M3 family oligoendopeptidase [Bacilli bacterium]